MSSVPSARPRLDPHDPAGIDALLSEEERAVRQAVRDFCADKINPHIAQWYEDGEFPQARELARELGKIGLLGMHLTGYGCAGMSAVDYGLACLELEAADSGLRSLVSVQGSLAMYAIWRFGSEAQKQEWLPPMAAGEAIGCFGLTEPDAGSDPAAMRTSARRDGADWVLNGRKMWITNGTIADVAVVWARTDDGIRGFVVPTAHARLLRPGDQAQGVAARLGHGRAGARLGAAARRRGAARGDRAARAAVVPERGALRDLVGGARRGPVLLRDGPGVRRARGSSSARRSASFQLTQEKLANMAVELGKGQLLALHFGRLKDTGRLAPEHVSFGKLNNTREALEICRTARTILGGNGISYEFPIMRHMANLESVLTYEGTPEMHTLVIGQALTGEQAFRK